MKQMKVGFKKTAEFPSHFWHFSYLRGWQELVEQSGNLRNGVENVVLDWVKKIQEKCLLVRVIGSLQTWIGILTKMFAKLYGRQPLTK